MPQHPPVPLVRRLRPLVRSCLALLAAAAPGAAQDVPQGAPQDPVFHTFSIVAVDAETGETGVAVTTRNTCVGNAVPWVRAGVGAVATQASTRIEYGEELLDLLEQGVAPAEALERALADDAAADRRQVGLVAADGGTAQHTGSGTQPWSGQRQGDGYAVQGNLLVGPGVLDAVVASLEMTAGTGRPLTDRLVAALEAGQAAGGDARVGRHQSAAVMVADPRPRVASRPDGRSVFLNVCEHPTPVAELRRQYDVASSTLGFRTLQRFEGRDVGQLKIMLHALGHLEPDLEELPTEGDWMLYDEATVAAVDRFRAARGLSTADRGSPAGLVDDATVAELWAALQEAGLTHDVRLRLRELTLIRR